MTQDKQASHPDDQALSELYQALKVEQPSDALDQAILARARQQAQQPGTLRPVSTIKHTKPAWRRWQWPLSVAASVCLVSVIFISQYQSFEHYSAGISESAEVAASPGGQAAPPPPPLQVQQQALAERQLADMRVAAETQHAMQRKAELAIMARRSEAEQALKLQESAVPARERLVKQLAEQQLQLSRLLAVQQEHSAVADSSEMLNDEGNSVLDVQVAMLNTMQQLHAVDADWQPEEQVLNLLSPEQQAAWYEWLEKQLR